MAVEELLKKKDYLPFEEEFLRFQNQLGFPKPTVYTPTFLTSRDDHNIKGETVIEEEKAKCISFVSCLVLVDL